MSLILIILQEYISRFVQDHRPRSPRIYGIPNADGAPRRLRIASLEPNISIIIVAK